jgi:N-acetylmuramoyl-L-alanine amidase
MANVYIDVGHGGKDPGAVDGRQNDPLYTAEKDVNLGIGLALNAALARCNIPRRLSRAGDTYPTLTQRSSAANSWPATIFVSVHCNAHTDGSDARGIEILHYPGSTKGIALGNAIMPFVTAVSPWADRKVRPDTRGLHVLSATKMPAVIVEYGFLTHTAEEALLATHAYQVQLAEATARGVCKYLGVAYVAPVGPTPPPVVTPPVTPPADPHIAEIATLKAEVAQLTADVALKQAALDNLKVRIRQAIEA